MNLQNLLSILFSYNFYFILTKNLLKILGIGDWGLAIGDWGLGIGPNPQSPIPNFKILRILINSI